MKHSKHSKWMIAAFFLNAVFYYGCNPSMVPIPDAAHDLKPLITVHSLPSGPGKVSPGEVSVTTGNPVGVTEKTTVLITVVATNMGGVKTLHLIGHWGGNKLWEATLEGSKNDQNMGPKTLSIIGHNGLGGIGSQPLLIVFDKLYETGYVEAEATNFNDQTQNLKVVYEVKPSNLVK